MATPVYSVNFLDEHNSAGPISQGVPADVVWVLRDVTFYWGGLLETTTAYLASLATNGTFVWTIIGENGDPGYYHWTGRQVFTAGNGWIFEAGTGIDVRLSGYWLSST